MSSIYNALSNLTNWLWGLPILILLVCGGIVLTVIISGIQFVHFGFIMKKTIHAGRLWQCSHSVLECTSPDPAWQNPAPDNPRVV